MVEVVRSSYHIVGTRFTQRSTLIHFSLNVKKFEKRVITDGIETGVCEVIRFGGYYVAMGIEPFVR